MSKTYKIITNGDGWAFEKPKPISELVEMLKTHPLQDFSSINKIKNGYRVWGNFQDYSHAFSVDVFDKKLLNRFRYLFRKNKVL